MNYLFWVFAGVACIILILLFSICAGSHRKSPAAGTVSKKGSVNRASIAKSWIPGNLLEEKLQSYRDHKIQRSAFISTLVSSEVFILSSGEGKTDPGDCDFIPWTGRTRLVPLYTSLYQLKGYLKEKGGDYTHIQIVKTRSWIPLLSGDYGLVVNPGHESSVELMPDDIAQLKLELS